MMTREEAIDFCKNNPEAAADIILMVEKLELRIKELEAKLNMDSTNSSKPPSSDNKLKKSKQQKKSASNKKRGAQEKHKGNTLEMVATPDEVKVLTSTHCSCCGESLEKAEVAQTQKRQCFDLPNVELIVTEYQAQTKECPKCHTLNKADFPEKIKAPTQYGENLKAFVSYLNTYQMLPYKESQK